VRENRLHGSEGGGTEANRSFLPLSERSEEVTDDTQPFGVDRRDFSTTTGSWGMKKPGRSLKIKEKSF